MNLKSDREAGGQYTALARFYDALNSEVNYPAWARGLRDSLRGLGVPDGAILLDLACGTGALTVELSALGYDMIGCDISPEMLNIARERTPPGEEILWLCQDMRSFELYGTVGAVICTLDSVNYLLYEKDLKSCFSLVHNYLDPGGIFIFDANTPYKFENFYSTNDFLLEADGIFCGWSNDWNEKTRRCAFYLTLFSEQPDGSYIRSDERQVERCWEMRTFKRLLKSAGFELLSVETDPNEPEGEETRWTFTARCVKS